MVSAVAIVVGLAVLVLLFKPVFGDWDNFTECVGYCFKPDLLSWIQGDWGEDFWAELKVSFWTGCGLAAGWGVYAGLMKLLG